MTHNQGQEASLMEGLKNDDFTNYDFLTKALIDETISPQSGEIVDDYIQLGIGTVVNCLLIVLYRPA